MLRAKWANRTGLICDCLPGCSEIELSIVKENKKGYISFIFVRNFMQNIQFYLFLYRIQMDHAIVEITLERLPSERLKRNVVRGKLDLVGR